MTQEPRKPGLTPEKAAAKARQQERLAAALRENLRRRKASQRAREGREGPVASPVGGSGDDGAR